MSKIESASNNLQESLNKTENTELIPYFDALKESNNLPTDVLESALYFLAKHLDLKPASANITDLRNAFKVGSLTDSNNIMLKAGLYYAEWGLGGANWKIYYNALMAGYKWKISATEKPEAILTKILEAFEGKDNHQIFTNTTLAASADQNDYSRRKSLEIAKILIIGKKGFEMLTKQGHNRDVLKKALTSKKSREAKQASTSQLDLLKLNITMDSVPENALQNKELFILWSLVIAGQLKKANRLDNKFLIDLKTTIDKKDILGAIHYIRIAYFTKDSNCYIGDNVINSNYKQIFWNEDRGSWNVINKENNAKELGLLANLYAEIKATSAYSTASRQFVTLRQYAQKNVGKLNENLADQLTYQITWQKFPNLAQEIPFLNEKANDWQFFKLSSTKVIAYSEKTDQFSIYENGNWKKANADEIKTIFTNSNNFKDLGILGPDATKLEAAIKLNGTVNAEEQIALINQIGLKDEKYFNDKKLRNIDEIRKELELFYALSLKDTPLFPPSTKRIEQLAKIGTNAVMTKIRAKVKEIPKNTLDQDPYFQIVIAQNGSIKNFETTTVKKQETLIERAKRRAAETKSGARRALDEINVTQRLRVQKYIFKDTFNRIREEIWQKNWRDYKAGKAGLAATIAGSVGQTFKHIFISTPYRSVKYGAGIALALAGLSAWYMKKSRAKRKAAKTGGNVTDDIMNGMEETKGFIAKFTGFLKGIKLPGKGGTLLGALATALSLGWLYKDKTDKTIPKPLKKPVNTAKNIVNGVLGAASRITELTDANKNEFIGKAAPTRIKLKVPLTLTNNDKITVPALAPADFAKSAVNKTNPAKADFFLPLGNYKINGFKRDHWLNEFYTNRKKFVWTAPNTGVTTIPDGTVLPKGTIITK